MGVDLRNLSPTLLLVVVAIGVRFWQQDTFDGNAVYAFGVHPRYSEIVQLLDVAISRLLLRPSAADYSLHTIQSLLLYVQWMPYDSCIAPSVQRGNKTIFKTRYNEMSTWTIFGLALRYASFCRLEQRTLRSFAEEANVAFATKEDLDSMRVWLNMVTYDCNLTLTSGMPASLNPEPMNAMALRICAHHAAQQPGDIRYASIVQLACIIQHVRREKDNIAQKRQVIAVVAKANEDFDAWQRFVIMTFFDRLQFFGY